ncbi:hypothetical protein F6X68_10285 [Micromonospora sp. AMSO12t]|nr:hypothetical protein F6X68_10285 [Micromonospora sp. AMSO12t]
MIRERENFMHPAFYHCAPTTGQRISRSIAPAAPALIRALGSRAESDIRVDALPPRRATPRRRSDAARASRWPGSARGVMPGTEDAERTIRYVTKYIIKHTGGCHRITSGRQRAHLDAVQELADLGLVKATTIEVRVRVRDQLQDPPPGLRVQSCMTRH